DGKDTENEKFEDVGYTKEDAEVTEKAEVKLNDEDGEEKEEPNAAGAMEVNDVNQEEEENEDKDSKLLIDSSCS
nr:hypothetical protein [Tanacetum cinerariifolium]